jgi:hypothetical protein
VMPSPPLRVRGSHPPLADAAPQSPPPWMPPYPPSPTRAGCGGGHLWVSRAAALPGPPPARPPAAGMRFAMLQNRAARSAPPIGFLAASQGRWLRSPGGLVQESGAVTGSSDGRGSALAVSSPRPRNLSRTLCRILEVTSAQVQGRYPRPCEPRSRRRCGRGPQTYRAFGALAGSWGKAGVKRNKRQYSFSSRESVGRWARKHRTQ